MKLYRIVRKKFSDDQSGEGAKIYGGRWNSIGKACLYTSTNISLCLCEYIVNLPTYLFPKDLQLVTYEISEKEITFIHLHDLPIGWNTIPVTNISQHFGDKLLMEPDIFAFSVPSAIIPTERNIILNPASINFNDRIKVIAVEPFNLDQRFEK